MVVDWRLERRRCERRRDRARLVQGNVGFKGVGLTVASGQRGVGHLLQEQFANRRGYRRGVVYSVVDRARLYVRGDQHGGNAPAPPPEIKKRGPRNLSRPSHL